jgi:hypothetical protein
VRKNKEGITKKLSREIRGCKEQGTGSREQVLKSRRDKVRA